MEWVLVKGAPSMIDYNTLLYVDVITYPFLHLDGGMEWVLVKGAPSMIDYNTLNLSIPSSRWWNMEWVLVKGAPSMIDYNTLLYVDVITYPFLHLDGGIWNEC